jgi:hypothetical protein
LETGLYDQVIDKLRGLPKGRQIELIRDIHKSIRKTGATAPGVGDLPMAALARRIYLHGLLLGIESKRRRGDKGGTPAPQHSVLETKLDGLSAELKIAGFAKLSDHEKTVELFCTHKVSEEGTGIEGFYPLVALFIWNQEEKGGFDPKTYRHHIPDSELTLGYDIGIFFARRLNQEAKAQGALRPFPQIAPARPETDLHRVQSVYLQHKEFADRAARLVEDYRTPRLPDDSFGDDNAHFILFRGRRSNATDLMKSFLVIKSLVTSPKDDRMTHHPTFHLYQAPQTKGGALWATPGRILPLKSGLFIIGGQHAEPLDQRSGQVRSAGAPFRALELIVFPWEEFDNAQLVGGLTMSVNKDGEPLIGRICARPTLLQTAKDACTGAVNLKDLETNVQADLKAERAAAKRATNVDAALFLDVYERFGSPAGLARRTAELCNNSSGNMWQLAPGLVKKGGAPLKDSDIEGMLDTALSQVVNANKEPFDVQRDIRIPPLTVM